MQSVTRRGTLREAPRVVTAAPRINRYSYTSCGARIKELEKEMEEEDDSPATRAELFGLLWKVQKYEEHSHNPHSYFQLPVVGGGGSGQGGGSGAAAAAAADNDDDDDVEAVPETIDLTGESFIDLDEYLEQVQTPGTPAYVAATAARAAEAARVKVKQEKKSAAAGVHQG